VSPNALLLVRGLVHAARGQYAEALKVFGDLFATSEDCAVASNYAVLLLYNRRAPEAVQVLEEFIRRNPSRYRQRKRVNEESGQLVIYDISICHCRNLDPCLVSNLMGAYQRCSFRAEVKRDVLSRLVEMYCWDDFDKSSLL